MLARGSRSGPSTVAPHSLSVIRRESIRNSWASVKGKYKPSKGSQARSAGLTRAQAFNLVRRVAILVAVLYFLYIEFAATAKTIFVLKNSAMAERSYESYESIWIGNFLGSGTIRDSPLVLEVLGNDTTPRLAGTLYLWNETDVRSEACPIAAAALAYSDFGLRMAFYGFQTSMASSVTSFAQVEMISPVVDCSFEGMIKENSVTRLNYLVRSVYDPNEVFFLVMTLSVQEYVITEQSRGGPTYTGTLAFVKGISAAAVDQFYSMALDYPYEAIPNFIVCEFLGTHPSGA